MNILYATTFLHFGAGRALLDLAKEAKTRGHDITIVATTKIDQYESQHNLVDEAEQSGISVVLCEDLFTRNYVRVRESAESIIKVFRTKQYNLIHSHTAIPGFAAALSSKHVYGKTLPHISSVHAWGPNKVDWMKMQDVLFLNSVDKVHSVSCDVSEYLFNEGVSKTIIHTIYNGCDFSRLDKLVQENEMEKYPKDKSFRIGTVADLSERKGIKYLVEAVSKLPHGLKDNMEVLIIGEGTEKRELVVLVEKLCLEGIVKFVGFESNPFKYIATFDLFVLPSLSEGLPVTLVEAMYLKIPVLTTNVQGNREIAGQGRGILVPAGDGSELAKGIEDFFDNRSLYNEKSNVAYNWVVQNFNRKAAFDKIFDLYDQCMK
jgi:glycosyltransferase involved in cell wall biosynthesis